MAEPCRRSGCPGVIVDGICGECGRPPVGGASLLSTLQPSQTMTAASQTAATSRGSARTGSRRQSSRSSRGSTSRRQSLGGGLVSLPPLPAQDPLKLVMAQAEVPERKRRCPSCDAKVSRTHGFCPSCGREYDFEPSLETGDLVHGKFEIKGPIAFGGLGWIYLAWDQTLSRWVVLKGLLNAKDAASAAAAVAERQFLAAVKHPKIVGIHDFISRGAEGFIVMEYVGGRTVKDIAKDRGGTLPVEEAISYILGILPAFAYLHGKGFVYCDFKSDNFMLEVDDVKLIDLGGVRRIGDPDGDIYGTTGFMAPEGAQDPIEVSDLYTIGRTLATLIMDFAYQGAYENSLPDAAEQTVLAQHDSLHRFLLRATHADPDQRFQSADDMADQLHGVLREIVALASEPKPSESRVFTGDNLLDADDEAGTRGPLPRLLPMLKLDVNDPAAPEILRLGAISDPVKRVTALAALAKKSVHSVEARLRLAGASIAAGEPGAAAPLLDRLETEDPFDWRVSWYRGLAALALHQPGDARSAFERVYFEMPGELAPKLAIAFAAETAGDLTGAAHFYDRVGRTDPGHTSACFGLARCRAAKGDAAGAALALAAVPAAHSLYTQSRIALARLLLAGERLDPSILHQAAETIQAIAAEGGIVHQLSARLFAAATALIGRGACVEDKAQSLLGQPMTLSALRRAAEREYREAGRFAHDAAEKMFWVNLANDVRPRTLF